jgi:glycosyltransferase involved in cell wall biosynthesis
MPKVSIVVPNYNHARFLRRRLDSILAQTFQDFELILLDDCSTDESRSILHEYASEPRVRLEFNEVNSGSAFKQWNKGVRLAAGEYVWIAESDDYANPRFLERLVGLLDNDLRVMLAYCRSWRVTHDDQLKGFEDMYLPYRGPHGWDADFCADGDTECRAYFLFVNPIPNASAVVFRKSVYDFVRGADERMTLCGDWKLWAAIAVAGRMAYVSEPLNYYRIHNATLRSKTARQSVSVPESLQVVRWILDRVPLTEEELIKVRRAHAAGWVPELMSTHISLAAKSKILGYAKAIDPHPMRRVAGPAIETIRRKLLRHLGQLRSRLTPAKT